MQIPNTEHKFYTMTVDHWTNPSGLDLNIKEEETRADYRIQRQVYHFKCCLLDETNFVNLRVHLDCLEQDYDYFSPLQEVEA